MKSRNCTLSCLFVVAFCLVVLQAGCTTTTKKSPPSSPAESVKEPSASLAEPLDEPTAPQVEAVKEPAVSPADVGISLSEVTDQDQFPVFKDDYGKIALLYSVDNSKEYFKRVKSYPESCKSIGFTPEKQIETLTSFRDGYLSSKSPQELSAYIAENFRIFQVVGNENSGKVHFKGYGLAVFGDDVERKWKHTVHYGSIGLPVTPMRSIVTREGTLPPGGLAFAVIESDGKVEESFFVLDQDDDGDAVEDGTVRVDVFFGIGKDAIHDGENFDTTGKLYYLLKR